MRSDSPIFGCCGYPAAGLDTDRCPECGRTHPDRPPRALTVLTAPRRFLLDRLWQPDPHGWERTARNIAGASLLAATAAVWLWLIDPIRGALGQPIQTVTILFHLVVVLAGLFALVGGMLIALEHTALLVIARQMHLTRAGPIAARIASISTAGLVLGGAAMLAIVAVIQIAGISGSVADTLPIGGVLAGIASSLRASLAGLWTAGLLREAGW